MYAELADVQARGGRLSGAWTDTSTPALSDLERFLDARQGEIDAALASRGLGIPVVDPVAVAALRSLHAAGALALALPATFPNREGPAAAAELMTSVAAEWQQGLAAILAGTHSCVAYLHEAGSTETIGGSFGDTDLDGGDYDPVVLRDEVF